MVKNKHASKSSPDIIPDKNGIAQFKFEFIPNEIHAHLLDKDDGKIIDSREYGTYNGTRHEGISVKTSTNTILSLIDGGESQIVEFKEKFGQG